MGQTTEQSAFYTSTGPEYGTESPVKYDRNSDGDCAAGDELSLEVPCTPCLDYP
jgi:hypothetical protein